MGRLNLSATRLLAQIQLECLPALKNAERVLVVNDHYHTSPEIQEAISLLRKIIPRLTSFQGARETRFWNRVDHRGQHMIWLGEGREGPSGAPVCEWMGRRTTASRVAWQLMTGEILQPGERIRRTCTEPRCVAPGCHQKAAYMPGRTTGTRLNAQGEPVCKSGHVLRTKTGEIRWPKPRETVYCRMCYADKKYKLPDRQYIGPVPFHTRPIITTPEGAPMITSDRLAASDNDDKKEAPESFQDELARMFNDPNS